MDPYCGWNFDDNICTTPPNNNRTASNWMQRVFRCSDSTLGGKWAN